MTNTEDLSRAATGYRALAYRYTRAAHIQVDPQTRAGFEREARELLVLAERFDRVRMARSSEEAARPTQLARGDLPSGG
jgi:hypothetical protein